MTPEQFQQYVTLANRNWEITCVVAGLMPIVALLFGVLGAYLKQKGKNIATKEDIGRITNEIKSVEAGFNERLESQKAALASKGYYNQLRYQREMEIFKELWPKLVEVNKATQSLRPIMDTQLTPGESQAERDASRGQLFFARYKALERAVYWNEPFVPAAIWKELRGLLNLFWYEAVDTKLRDGRSPSDYWQSAMKNKDDIDKLANKVSEAIRQRLAEFD